MKVTFTVTDLQAALLEFQQQTDITYQLSDYESTLTLPKTLGKGQLNNVNLRKGALDLFVQNHLLDENLVIAVVGSSPASSPVALKFFVSGPVNGAIQGIKADMSVSAGQYGFVYCADQASQVEFVVGKDICTVEIVMTPQLFQTMLDDDHQVITFDPLTTLVDSIGNADASITGFELEARATPLDGLDITAGFGLADADFTDYPNRPDLDGNALPFAPEFTYNLGLQYRSPMGIFGRIELAGLGATFFDEDNTLKQEPYAIVNARLGYELDNYGVYLFANNLFDKEYTTSQFASLGTTRLGGYGVPATFGMQLKARF